jgi:hypothetical protein
MSPLNSSAGDLIALKDVSQLGLGWSICLKSSPTAKWSLVQSPSERLEAPPSLVSESANSLMLVICISSYASYANEVGMKPMPGAIS